MMIPIKFTLRETQDFRTLHKVVKLTYVSTTLDNKAVGFCREFMTIFEEEEKLTYPLPFFGRGKLMKQLSRTISNCNIGESEKIQRIKELFLEYKITPFIDETKSYFERNN